MHPMTLQRFFKKGKMMKSVLISTNPKWVFKICNKIGERNGKPLYEKTDEVRKTKPKIDVHFKCYIYCTKNGESLIKDDISTTIGFIAKNRGKVIGEFVCDRLTFLDAYYDTNGNRHLCNTAFIKSCVPDDELFDYLYGKHGETHGGWAWHISDLVIYDKPRGLEEFHLTCDHTGDCCTCRHYDNFTNGLDGRCLRTESGLTRPPQSWCYVEEV